MLTFLLVLNESRALMREEEFLINFVQMLMIEDFDHFEEICEAMTKKEESKY